MHLFSKSIAALALGLSAFGAQASVVTFSDTSTVFADGSYSAGFYPLGSRDGATLAYNDSGHDVSVFFNAPVWLQSLTLLAPMEMEAPNRITVTLYDAAHRELASQFLNTGGLPFWPDRTFTFETANVSALAFTLGSPDEASPRVYFQVQDISYALGAPAEVPEPAALALFGLGACAAVAGRRKRAARA